MPRNETAAVLLGVCLGLAACDKTPTGPEASSPTAEPAVTQAATLAAAGPLVFQQVSAGARHTCGVTTDSRAYCWGDNRFGQLGNGLVREGDVCAPTSGEPEQTCSTRPVAVVGGHRFLQLSSGLGHTCGISTEHVMYCWGQNELGQAGNGYTGRHRHPDASGDRPPLPGGERWR